MAAFPEARVDPPEPRNACRCDRLEDARAVEDYLTEEAVTAEWKGSKKHRSITTALEELLDEFYHYGQCEECKDEPFGY